MQWSDGKPFSAHDVAYTLNLWKEYPALDTRNAWEYLKSVVAVSDTLVHIDFKRIYVPGFEAIAGAYIVPKHIWRKVERSLLILVIQTLLVQGPLQKYYVLIPKCGN